MCSKTFISTEDKALRKIPIEYVRNGDVLARTIYSNQGGMLLKEGFVLEEGILKKLKRHGYFTLHIKDKYSDDTIDEIIKPEIMNRIHIINNNLTKMIVDFSNNKSNLDSKKINRQVEDLNKIIEEIISDIMTSKSILENLSTISVYDDYTMTHSLNMMMLSIAIAKDVGLSLEGMKKLAIGCVFHDIGKTFLPIEIINKQGSLTKEEYEMVKSHTEKGYGFLENCTDLPIVSRNVSLSHHERTDGFGYPNGLKGDEIHVFSKVAAISDVFDALISDRPYRRAIPVHEAWEYIIGGGSQFDLNIIRIFSKTINPFPKGTLVYLSDGKEGVVHEIRKSFYTRPKIMVYGEQGQKVKPYIFDIIEYNSITIKKVLHIFSFD